MTDLTPRYRYECGHCRFSWCCGPLCYCVFGKGELPEPPRQRAREVARLVRAWRRKRGL